MRPAKMPPAHITGNLGELVCSNSLGADKTTSPAGILKQEIRLLDSLVMRCADMSRVPAGKALAVDRDLFSTLMTREIANHANIDLIRSEVTEIPDLPAIIAAGPLMSGGIADAVRDAVGEDCLSFFDAAAPIVTAESVDMDRAYMASRYGEGNDYINCPMNRELYEAFLRELVTAERVPLHDVDRSGCDADAKISACPTVAGKFFEGCLPVEVMAERGVDTLRFGPMRPVGLPDPSTGRDPYAVVQLRQDNAEGTLYNIVGFQTNLKWPEQERVFRMIPALERAEFVRKGVMHRNSFVCAPRVLDYHLRPLKNRTAVRDDLHLAGQITGVEGYVESAATGLVAAIHLFGVLKGEEPPKWPRETAIGSLLNYLQTSEADSFQPMNVNIGIFPKIETAAGQGRGKKMGKPERALLYAERSRRALESFLASEARLSARR
jgi:methylenetetrahydrofolate--tRNA-(uracil-5-)-methyltransferase